MKGFRGGLLPRQTHLHYRPSMGGLVVGGGREIDFKEEKNPENPATEADVCITKGKQRRERCGAWE